MCVECFDKKKLYQTDDQRRAERRRMEEMRLVDEQMRKINFDKKEMDDRNKLADERCACFTFLLTSLKRARLFGCVGAGVLDVHHCLYKKCKLHVNIHRLEKSKKNKAEMIKRNQNLNAYAAQQFDDQSFDKNEKLLRDYRKTDVVYNPPKKRELVMGGFQDQLKLNKKQVKNCLSHLLS